MKWNEMQQQSCWKARFTARLEGTTPNSTAALPVTRSLHFKTGLSCVVREDTSNFGPSWFCMDTLLIDPLQSGREKVLLIPTIAKTLQSSAVTQAKT